MPTNHLEQLVAEWLEYQGYFVRRNVRVGKRREGGYVCELDIVAFHPTKLKLVQYEPSTDTSSWDVRERRYRKKFDAGKRFVPGLFDGLSIPPQVDQFAVFLYGSRASHQTVGGGRVLMVSELLAEIVSELKDKRIAKAMVPEQFQVLRTLQLACEYRGAIFGC